MQNVLWAQERHKAIADSGSVNKVDEKKENKTKWKEHRTQRVRSGKQMQNYWDVSSENSKKQHKKKIEIIF